MVADVSIHQGEDATIKVTCFDQAGAVKNLVGAVVAFRIGDKRAESFTFAKAGTLPTGGGDGVVQVVLTAAETAALDPQTYDFQFIVTDATSDTQVVFEGEIDIDFVLPES